MSNGEYRRSIYLLEQSNLVPFSLHINDVPFENLKALFIQVQSMLQDELFDDLIAVTTIHFPTIDSYDIDEVDNSPLLEIQHPDRRCLISDLCVMRGKAHFMMDCNLPLASYWLSLSNKIDSDCIEGLIFMREHAIIYPSTSLLPTSSSFLFEDIPLLPSLTYQRTRENFISDPFDLSTISLHISAATALKLKGPLFSLSHHLSSSFPLHHLSLYCSACHAIVFGKMDIAHKLLTKVVSINQ